MKVFFVCPHPWSSIIYCFKGKANTRRKSASKKNSQQNGTVNYTRLRSLMHVCVHCKKAAITVIDLQNSRLMWSGVIWCGVFFSSSWSHPTTTDPLNTKHPLANRNNSKTTTILPAQVRENDLGDTQQIQNGVLSHFIVIHIRHADAPQIQHRFNSAHSFCKSYGMSQ